MVMANAMAVPVDEVIFNKWIDVFTFTPRVGVFYGSVGTLSNEDGNVNDDGSEKSHFWFSLYLFVRIIRV